MSIANAPVKFFSFLLIALTLTGDIAISQVKYAPEVLKKIKQVEGNICGNILVNDERPYSILERMKYYKVKGVSIAVIENYKVAWAKGYGWADEGEKRPVTPETLFEPGSISKALNAVGILKLAQEGKVKMNEDVNNYLTSWKFPYDSVAQGKKISLANILSHYAGLSVHGFPGHNINGKIPCVTDVLDGKKPALTLPVRSMMEPDLGYMYSGGGVTISQLLLTDVTHEKYDVWMQNNVLKPLGMANSFFSQPPPLDKRALCAAGYTKNGVEIPGKFHVYPEQAAAGLWTNPTDLSKYIIDLQRAGRGGHSKVLNSDMIKLHLTQYKDGPTSMGLFLIDKNGAQYFEHGAGNDGFCGDFVASMVGGYGCVVFMNSEDPKLLQEIINSVAKAYNWKNYYQAPKRKKCVTVPDSSMMKYEGIYVYEQKWAAVYKNGNEYNFYLDGNSVKMYFTSPKCFFNEEFAAIKEFTYDKTGNINGYTRTVDGTNYPPAKKVYEPEGLDLSAMSLHEISLFLLDNKKYSEAIKYLQAAVKLYPEDREMLLNLANMYVFNDEYDKAFTIFKAHINDKIGTESNWIKVFQFYIGLYKEHNYDVSKFDKVFREFNIQQSE